MFLSTKISLRQAQNSFPFFDSYKSQKVMTISIRQFSPNFLIFSPLSGYHLSIASTEPTRSWKSLILLSFPHFSSNFNKIWYSDWKSCVLFISGKIFCLCILQHIIRNSISCKNMVCFIKKNETKLGSHDLSIFMSTINISIQQIYIIHIISLCIKIICIWKNSSMILNTCGRIMSIVTLVENYVHGISNQMLVDAEITL